MNLIIEALFVALYTSLFSFIPQLINVYFYLFIIGFLKHSISYYIGIQNFYCLYNGKKKATDIHIFIDSFFEGIIFIVLGIIIIKLFQFNMFKSLFLLGFFLHLIAEFIHLHSFFINYRCIL
jgi:hypothetical protein